jgi:hypothetical protein
MYPIFGPGTPEPCRSSIKVELKMNRSTKTKFTFVPGVPPRTLILPWFKDFVPTIQESSVVFPQPDAPSKPYLEIKRTTIKY